MKEISMLEFRTAARDVIKGLMKGRRFILTYRGRALAKLEPVVDETKFPQNDPFFVLKDKAIKSPLNGLNHKDIDQLLYE
jgi:antitoxin (DNA-binding transcriptional repressor) of toxin-antitoxin stability system